MSGGKRSSTRTLRARGAGDALYLYDETAGSGEGAEPDRVYKLEPVDGVFRVTQVWALVEGDWELAAVRRTAESATFTEREAS